MHEARKQAKYLSLALEVLQAAAYTPPRMLCKRATATGKHLGVDRDLALLQFKLTTVLLPKLPARQKLLLKIEALRMKLQVKVFQIAKLMYAEEASAMNLRRIISRI